MSVSDLPPPAVPIPIHSVSYNAEGQRLTVASRGGRARKVRPAPSVGEQTYLERLARARDAHVAADALVRALRGAPGADAVVQAVIEGLAREAASTSWE